MKTIHIAALAVLLALAACGADPKASTEAHDEAGSEHGEEGHEDEEAGHDEAGGKHEEAPSTVIPESIAEEAGIQVRGASGGVIADEHEVQGLLTPVEGRHARVVARFPGPVTSVRVAAEKVHVDPECRQVGDLEHRRLAGEVTDARRAGEDGAAQRGGD